MLMDQQHRTYRSIRREQPTIPAYIAWHQAGRQVAIAQWAEAVGFEWREGDNARTANWIEGGYHLQASIAIDEAGWDLCGIDDIGYFTGQWQPGAIEHDRWNPRTLRWFIPDDPAIGGWLYRRACRYGDDWWYVDVRVTASRSGIELGSALLGGLESDNEESFLTETVFDLAHEAMAEAQRSLETLCNGQTACA
ncbi:hypothetical protein [Salinisphaera orenii]|uniref:hypothetical protein n=1 Tax=Salinisphaera orenii TaxID=856731 RepID=UPI000DBE36D9